MGRFVAVPVGRGMVGSVLVLLGGLVVSTLPASSPVAAVDGLVLLRGHVAGRMLGLSLVLAGLALLAGAWLALCRLVSRSPHELGLVRRAALLWSLPLLVAPPLFSRDGWSYAAQGVLVHVGLSPYDVGPGVLAGPVVEAVDPRWMSTPTPYGPLPLLLGDALADVTGDPWLLVLGHRLVALAGLVLLAWAVPRLAAWTGVNPGLASALVVASPFMVANGVGGLHNDLLMAGLMAAALVVAAEHGWVAGALLGGAAAAVKVPGGLVCIPVALVGLPAAAALVTRVRRLVAVGALSGGVLVVFGLVTGLGLGWLGALTVPGTVNTPLSLPTVLGGLLDRVAAVVVPGVPESFFLGLVRGLASLGLVILAAVLALRGPAGDRAVALRLAAVLTGATVLLSPVVHLWYFLWVTPFLATLRLPRAGTVLLLAGSVVFGLAAPLDSSLHGAYLAIVWGVAGATSCAAVLLLTRPARQRLLRISGAAGPAPAGRLEARRPSTSRTT